MIIKKYPAPPIETAASRYDRDWLHIPDLDTAGNDDDRHDRTLLQQTVERKSRRYVDDGVSAVTGGSPVFDPTTPGDSAPVDPGDTDNNIIFTDDFSGTELDSRWSVFLGDLNLSPLRPVDGGDGFTIRTVEPLSGLNAEITANLNLTNASGVTLGFFTKEDNGEFQGIGPQVTLVYWDGTFMAAEGAGSSFAHERTTMAMKDVTNLTFRIEDDVMTTFINGETADDLTAATSDFSGKELYPMIAVMSEGSVTSATVKMI